MRQDRGARWHPYHVDRSRIVNRAPKKRDNRGAPWKSLAWIVGPPLAILLIALLVMRSAFGPTTGADGCDGNVFVTITGSDDRSSRR